MWAINTSEMNSNQKARKQQHTQESKANIMHWALLSFVG